MLLYISSLKFNTRCTSSKLCSYIFLSKSVVPICLPLLQALFSCFTASLPNLTVKLLIRRSVSQAVLSFCLNIHLLSVYLHLRKNLQGLACAVLLPPCRLYLSGCLAFGFFVLSIVFSPRSMFNLTVFPFSQEIHGLVYKVFLSK